MTELKTLKDLQSNWEGLISKEELKAEAVKWVKFLDKKEKKYKPTYEQFIEHFFNLTEEYLKNE